MTAPESKEPTTPPTPEAKEPTTTSPAPAPAPEKKEDPVEPKPSFMHFVKDNLCESVCYVILFCGLIFSIFNPFLGGSLVGLILGIYFSQEVIEKASSFKEFIIREGIFRGFIIVAAVLALLIEAPGLLVGTVIGAWVRPYLGKAICSPFDKK
jgi:hypothetical protein